MFKNRLVSVFLMGKGCKATHLIQTENIRHLNTRTLSHKDLMQSGSNMAQIREDLRIIMGVEKAYTPLPKSRAHLEKYLPTHVNELPTRSMADSFMTSVIPLSTDIELREKYITFLGGVRVGRLLEDMDIFAVVVAMRYIYNPKIPEGIHSPYTLVTAAVDRIDFTSYNPSKDNDIRLSGHVTYVGRSSMEVMVWADQKHNNVYQTVNRALFVLAARNATATKSAFVNELKPSCAAEEAIFSGGLKRREIRKHWQAMQVNKVIPTQEEHQILHGIYLKSIPAGININKIFVPPGCVQMETATLTNLHFSQPQDRNFHNRVFGGFLMRKAMELAWITCYLYAKHRPQLKCISDIVFNKPIPVNSLIRMHSYISYTIMNYVQITLYTETLDAVSGENVTTNALHFTFECTATIPEILPNTYHENMMYIDARRRFLDVMDANENLINLNPIPQPAIE